MWRNREDFTRAILAVVCLVACFTIVILSWPDGSRTRPPVMTPSAVVIRATVPDRAEIVPAAYTGSINGQVVK
jgi:hypothetical protein